jgi:predicted nucleic acid-binding Zn ribbon protein
MSRPAKYRKFRSVGSVLPRVLKGLKLDKVLAAHSVANLWPQIAGPKTAEHTRAVEVDGKTLVIVVDGPGWTTQLRFLKPQLLKKIDGRVGKGLITDLRFVLGNAEGKWKGERGNDEVRGRNEEG